MLDSIRSEDLRYAPVGWVRRLAWGASLLAVVFGLLALVPLIGLFPLAAAVFAFAGALEFGKLLAVAAGPAIVLCVPAGWLFTAPDPRQRGRREGAIVRRVVRGVLVALFVASVILLNEHVKLTRAIYPIVAAAKPDVVTILTLVTGLILSQFLHGRAGKVGQRAGAAGLKTWAGQLQTCNILAPPLGLLSLWILHSSQSLIVLFCVAALPYLLACCAMYWQLAEALFSAVRRHVPTRTEANSEQHAKTCVR